MIIKKMIVIDEIYCFTFTISTYISNSYIYTVKPLYKKPLYKKNLYKNIFRTFGWNSTFSTLKNLYKKIL